MTIKFFQKFTASFAILLQFSSIQEASLKNASPSSTTLFPQTLMPHTRRNVLYGVGACGSVRHSQWARMPAQAWI